MREADWQGIFYGQWERGERVKFDCRARFTLLYIFYLGQRQFKAIFLFAHFQMYHSQLLLNYCGLSIYGFNHFYFITAPSLCSILCQALLTSIRHSCLVASPNCDPPSLFAPFDVLHGGRAQMVIVVFFGIDFWSGW